MKNKTKNKIIGYSLVIGLIAILMYMVYIGNPKLVLPFGLIFVLLIMISLGINYIINKKIIT